MVAPARPRRPSLPLRAAAGAWHVPAGFGFILRRPGLWPFAALPAALKRKRKPYPPDPREATPFQMWRWEARVQWHYRSLMRSGIFSDRLPEGDFLYFALSVTPEASTCIEAPQYADQLVVIGALARGLPAGWRLVVKDHLPMCGRRTLEFYRCASQYPNVVLVNPIQED